MATLPSYVTILFDGFGEEFDPSVLLVLNVVAKAISSGQLDPVAGQRWGVRSRGVASG